MSVVEDMTIGEFQRLASALSAPSGTDAGPWKIGKKYIVMTCTRFLVGRLSYVGDQELVLDDASWVADTGRFNETMKSGAIDEVEPYFGPAIVGRGAITDASEWSFDLPAEAK